MNSAPSDAKGALVAFADADALARACAEQVAGDEPAIAANSAQANTLAMPSPPGILCIQACRAV